MTPKNMTPDSLENENTEAEPNNDVAPQVEPPVSKPTRVPFAKSLNLRIGMVVYGILVPIVCHILTMGNSPESAEWQSGKLADKLSFVLSGECGWPIFPFLIFAMVCLGIVVRNEAEAISKPWVRLGIFSGVIVCGWYLFAFSWTAMGSPWSMIGELLGAATWLFVVHGGIWLLKTIITRLEEKQIVALVGGMISLALLAIVITQGGAVLLPLMIILILSTPLALLTYLWASIRILKHHAPSRRITMAQLMIWVTWLAAFFSALRTTIKLSFAKYAELPLEPPENCYVATAAANGFPTIVGSQSLPTVTGQPLLVNSQLATFKAAELTLRAVWPTGHRAFRFAYDRLGPRAARLLRGPLIATAAYLCLKPAEWFCWFVLRVLLGREIFEVTKQLYLNRAKQ